MMDYPQQTRRLIAAEVDLAWTARRLAETQVAALLGLSYDDREYDRMILKHRRARATAAAVRQSVQRRPATPAIAA
jgi:hypothetical protein